MLGVQPRALAVTGPCDEITFNDEIWARFPIHGHGLAHAFLWVEPAGRRAVVSAGDLSESPEIALLGRIHRQAWNIPATPVMWHPNLVPALRVLQARPIPEQLAMLAFSVMYGQHEVLDDAFLAKGFLEWADQQGGHRGGWPPEQINDAFELMLSHLALRPPAEQHLFPIKPANQILGFLARAVYQTFGRERGRQAYIAQLFLLACYNRLVARRPDELMRIRPDGGGAEWLAEQTEKAFGTARLVFNYWLIQVECVLSWWTDERGNRA